MATYNSKIETLIKSGLGNDKNVGFYRKVLSNPSSAPSDPSLRKISGNILQAFVEFFMTDELSYNRLRNFLLKNRAKSFKKPITEAGLFNLIKKSVEKDIPLEIIEEVYARGYDITFDNPQNKGFDRVNSFLSGGKALEMDKDLIERYYLNENKSCYHPPDRSNKVLKTIHRVIHKNDKI